MKIHHTDSKVECRNRFEISVQTHSSGMLVIKRHILWRSWLNGPSALTRLTHNQWPTQLARYGRPRRTREPQSCGASVNTTDSRQDFLTKLSHVSRRHSLCFLILCCVVLLAQLIPRLVRTMATKKKKKAIFEKLCGPQKSRVRKMSSTTKDVNTTEDNVVFLQIVPGTFTQLMIGERHPYLGIHNFRMK